MAGDLPPSSKVAGVRFFCGRLGHLAAYGGGAGKNQVIEGQGSKLLSDRGISRDHNDLIRRKGLGDAFAQRFGKGRSQFRGFDHRAITGGKRTDERPQCQLQRIISRADDADDTQWLPHDHRFTRLIGQGS